MSEDEKPRGSGTGKRKRGSGTHRASGEKRKLGSSAERRALRPPPPKRSGAAPLAIGALALAIAILALVLASRSAPSEGERPIATTAPVAKPAPPPPPPPPPAEEETPRKGPRFLEAQGEDDQAPAAPVAPEKAPPPEPPPPVEAEKPRVPAGVPADAVEARVVKCVDGDTIVVSLRGKDERIRMKGVDTPETVHPTKPVERYGKEASNYTKARLSGKTVWLELGAAGGRDKYGRLLAFIWCEDGTCHNENLIREGYGHAYTRYPFDRMEKYRALEREAREGKRGLWGP